jgi:hypothetical protein
MMSAADRLVAIDYLRSMARSARLRAAGAAPGAAIRLRATAAAYDTQADQLERGRGLAFIAAGSYLMGGWQSSAADAGRYAVAARAR